MFDPEIAVLFAPLPEAIRVSIWDIRVGPRRSAPVTR